MPTIAAAAQFLGTFLLLLTVVSSFVNAGRRQDRHRLDVVVFLLIFVGALFPQGLPFALAIRMGMLAALPYAAIRLIKHFRDVPALLTRAAVVLIGAAVVGALVAPDSRALTRPGLAYTAAALLCASAAMAWEARRSRGVKPKRLALASLGLLLFACSQFTGAIQGAEGTSIASVEMQRYLTAAAYLCFYLAFSPPRPLITRWRRAEQADYLATASDREPEERGRQAADDLFQAAVRGVGGAVTLVATRGVRGDQPLTVARSSDPAFAGVTLAPDTGLIGAVVAAKVAGSGPPWDAHPAVGRAFASRGMQVLVAPIASADHVWGVVLVVHRRGALFPEDDLVMLAHLGRDAGTSLDHAQLIIERREQARRAADRRLREVESLVGLMLDSIKDYAMLVIDAHGHVASWQLGAQHLFGYSREQVTDLQAASMYDLTPAEFAVWLAEARASGRAEREGPCRRSDGTTFAGATLITPLASESGEPQGFVAVTRDVTERRQLEERLRESQKMEAVGQLAGGIAHDFNNLLTAISGYAGLLEHRLGGSPLAEEAVEIQKAADRAASLVRQLLAFSRRKMLQPSLIDLTALIVDLLPMLERLVTAGIEITTDMASGLPMVWGNQSQIEQVIVNLIVNARDALPEGGRITMRTAAVLLAERGDGSSPAPGSYVLLEVADTGIGMDAETKRRVFEPFFTTKEVGKGTGLGLSTVYGIVQEMGGTVEIESELRRGTTFRLYLPEGARAGAAGTTAAATPTEAETLVLVEDDEAARRYLQGVLERHGYRVLAAAHPASALTLSKAFGKPVDLVISDVVLPGGGGSELVQLLGRQRPGIAALHIYESSEGILTRQRPDCGLSSLARPHSPAALIERVRQILSAA